MPDRFVLVLAGGRGERFWPWSRPERPKQLLPLARGGGSLLGATLQRALAFAPGPQVMVLTGRDLKPAVERECRGTGVRVLGEPVGRNTAPAIAVIAAWLVSRGADPAFAVMPADHAIEDAAAFHADLERAFAVAEREAALVTFGIPPAAPRTSFGYMQRGARLGERLFRVDRFTEKPDAERASRWVASGEYVWNSGIFVWRCSTFLRALEAGRPALAEALEGLAWGRTDADFERRLDQAYPELESVSVDYAVLEPAPNVLMIQASFDWDDLGSWAAWARCQPRDARGNVLFGDAVALDCEGCVVVGEDGTAAAMGLRNMVVVHTQGATLTCRLEDSDNVRRVTEAVRNKEAT